MSIWWYIKNSMVLSLVINLALSAWLNPVAFTTLWVGVGQAVVVVGGATGQSHYIVVRAKPMILSK